MPRSLTASADGVVDMLSHLGERSGRQGPADRLARQRLDRLRELDIQTVFQGGLHEWLQDYIRANASIGEAIAQQFRFG
jgi:uncharacterized alpha-E superfamily protein